VEEKIDFNDVHHVNPNRKYVCYISSITVLLVTEK